MLGLVLGLNKSIFISTPWTPSVLTTSLWLDASVTDSITEIGNNVSKWDDLSGNNNHVTQAVGTNQPDTNVSTLNGLNVLSFGAVDFMDLTSNAVVKAVIWVIKELDSSVTVNSVFTNATDDEHTFINTSVGAGYSISIDGSVGATGNASVNGEDLVAGTNIDLGLSEAEKKGANIWYTDYDSEITDAKELCKGAGLNYLKGDLCEIIFLPTIPNEANRQKLEGYLAHKWGLVSSLATGHPYISNAPTV